MEAQFESSFRRYAERACNRLGSYSTTQREETTLRILPNRTSLLRSSVDELEAHSAFSQLVSDVHETFSGTEFRRSLSGWQRSIGNFLRRSGFYSEIFEGSSIDIGSFFKLLVASVRRKEHTVRYFVPLEFVDFSRPTIEFGTSSIQRFSTDRLSEIFQLKTNEAFFPWAFFDIEQLAYYWFLCVEEKIPARNPEVLEFDLSGIERVDIQYASLPSPVVAAVHRLVLFSWQASFWGGAADVVDAAETDKGRGWMGFGIPFVMKCDDNLLASPSVVPNLSGLATEPVFDPRTDEEVGEKPAIYIYLDEQETETFEIFINRIDSMIEGLPLKQKNCRFLDIAFGNLTKGFFAEGLDQLLWHIVTLEALVGEDREGLGTIIARSHHRKYEKREKEYREAVPRSL